MPFELVLLRSRGWSAEEAILVLILVAVVVALIWYFSKAQRIKRELRSMKSWHIGELPESVIGRIVGAAQPFGESLKSPLTGRTCVYYRATVSTSGKNSREVILEERAVPFVLDDGTGRAVIDPHGADLAIELDSHTTSGSFDDATEVEESFLARHDESSKGMLFNRGLVYTESVIEVGETVAVLGAALREPDPEATTGAGYRDGPRTRVRMQSSPRFKLKISDDPSTTTR